MWTGNSGASGGRTLASCQPFLFRRDDVGRSRRGGGNVTSRPGRPRSSRQDGQDQGSRIAEKSFRCQQKLSCHRCASPVLPPSARLKRYMAKGRQEAAKQSRQIQRSRKSRLGGGKPQGPPSVRDSRYAGMRHSAHRQRSKKPARWQAIARRSYARVKEGEVWLVGADIAEYPQATLWNHVPKRPRKLLCAAKSGNKFANQAHEKGPDARAAQGLFQCPRPGEGAARSLPRQKTARQTRVAEKGRQQREIDRAMRQRR